MPIMPIYIVGEPILQIQTEPVIFNMFCSFNYDILLTLIKDMFDTMQAANGVGLAANQIGNSKRIFVYNCTIDNYKKISRCGVVINPVLETSSIPESMPNINEDEEGCLSVPNEYFPLGRARWASVTGLDITGSLIYLEGVELFARMLQHEIGHLDGHLYIERLLGRYKREAKKKVRRNNWGAPGLSWIPK